ncbi:hypothetical protein JW766_01515 [Candidatus Dojkabacteria bacterium]|nr:hypothetical protein [Candidatus Dojkabacteria bacterium]
MVNKKRIIIKALIVLFSLFSFLGIAKEPVSASANLYVSPSGGTYYQGNTFTVGVYVSANEAINAVEVNISYDSSKLSIASCGAVTTTFGMVADGSCPSITVGTTGSWSGSGAQVAYATFRANGLGSASVSVTGRTAMNGGEVSTSGISRTFSIAQYNPIPSAPSVMSASHPDGNAWYKEKMIELSWGKDSGVIGFSYILDQSESTVPDDMQESDGTGANLEASSDGVWFFHIKARSAGGWGDTAHYKVQVDSTAPFFASEPAYEDKGDLQPVIFFAGDDSLSGMDYYEIEVDSEFLGDGVSPYKTKVLPEGEHEIIIRAYDLAGNVVQKTLSISVGKLLPPFVTELLVEQLFLGPVSERIIVRGTAPANAKIIVQISDIFVSEEVYADEAGLWEYVYEGGIEPGDYAIRGMTVLEGNSSEYSELYTFTVGKEGVFSLLPRTGDGVSSGILFVSGGLIFGALFATGVLLFIANKKGLIGRKKDVNFEELTSFDDGVPRGHQDNFQASDGQDITT